VHPTTSDVTLVVAVFLASAVESVEALTIIVAAGVSRGWRSALEGMAVALVALVVLVGTLGPALVYLVPIDVLRAVVGTLLLVFGLQWLRKAVLRAVGLKAKHDEDVIYRKHVDALVAPGDASDAPARRPQRDPAGFAVAFKGTFLEGMEVAIIVLGLGGGDHQLGLASAAAGAAILVVGGVGVVVARHLAGVPENAMKIAVGLMLVSFGTFWTGEGLGVRWPGSDLAIVVLVAAYAVVTWLLVQLMRPSGQAAAREQAHAT
jgi:Ca2+/H+ antiporter, TMEM165/GDT1 family